jgi:50S ribosomal subunit-associated GTPase HflX
MLVANKKDLIECVEDPVSEEEINKYCEKLNLKVIYTSAKTGENVETAFTEIITMVIENKRQTINLADESGSRKD